ncbi:hypothetical protein C8R42DRAFT_720493 [Lentinula raphanica]|nr:hypothetical protein C8R42DRAFT_720493 [Lentinula raphanica]
MSLVFLQCERASDKRTDLLYSLRHVQTLNLYTFAFARSIQGVGLVLLVFFVSAYSSLPPSQYTPSHRRFTAHMSRIAPIASPPPCVVTRWITSRSRHI